MLSPAALLAAGAWDSLKENPLPVAFGIVFLIGLAVVFGMLAMIYGNIWFQAYMSNARVSMLSLVGMSLRQVNARVIVQSKIMAMQAGIANDPSAGITLGGWRRITWPAAMCRA